MANQRRSVVSEAVSLDPAQIMQGAIGIDKKRIGELLVEQDVITTAQLNDALEMQAERGVRIVEALIFLGHISVDDFITFLARQPGVASIELGNYHVPRDILGLVPQELAEKHEIFPIDKLGHLLTLGMACPLDSNTIMTIEESTGLKVKALLCPPEDIKQAINLYYKGDPGDFKETMTKASRGSKTLARQAPLTKSPGEFPVSEDALKAESGFKLGRISKLIRRLETLPALPSTVDRVHEAVSDLNVSANDVAQTIIKDPPIAAKVLSVANSAAYGFSNKVATVELAVALLGLRETYTIVLSAAVLNLFEKNKIFNYQAYWEEAMNCAAAAKLIARAADRERDSSIFTAGLLHDIGRIALLETVPEIYVKVSPELVGDELIEAEEKHLGLTHTEAGYELATRWNLPDELALPIRFHHHPNLADSLKENVAIVSLAERWTRIGKKSKRVKKKMLKESADLFDVIGLSEEASSHVFEDVAALEPAHFEWTARSH